MILRLLIWATIALLSGAAALTHEFLWTRRLVDLVGGTGQSISLVLGCFFLGLSLGAALATRFVERLTCPWQALAIIELGIGLLTIPAAILPWWSEWIWQALGTELLISGWGAAVKLILSVLVVIPPAVAMGMTLPVLIRAIRWSCAGADKLHVLVYGTNTLGGSLGLLVAASWLLPTWGVFRAMVISAATNFVVAALAWSMGMLPKFTPAGNAHPVRQSTSGEKHEATVNSNAFGKRASIGPPLVLNNCALLALSGYSGFSILAFEIVAVRMVSLVVPSSFQAANSVLLTVIFLLAVASIVVPLTRISPSPITTRLAVFLTLSGSAIALAPFLMFDATHQLLSVTHLVAVADERWLTAWGFGLAVLKVTVVSLGPALLLGGMIFPTLLDSISDGHREQVAGRWAAALAVNGMGGALGAMTANYLLLPGLGIYGALVLIGTIQVLAACLLLFAMVHRWMLLGCIPIVLAAAFLLDRANALPYISPRTEQRFDVIAKSFGHDGVCLVVDASRSGRGILMNNQYLLGSTSAFDDHRRQLLLPLVLHPQPKDVCCLGLATGISAGAAIDFRPPVNITVIELSPLVVAAAANHFGAVNRNIVRQENARVLTEDARTYLAAAHQQFDVIVGDLYRPYGAGEGRLFAVEHFCNVRQALREGGVFCQWLPAHQLTESHFRTIAATFVDVFPDAKLIKIDDNPDFPLLALLGTHGAAFHWQQVDERCRQLSIRTNIKDRHLASGEAIRSLIVGQLSADRFIGVKRNTLDNASLEIAAGLRKATWDPRKSHGAVGTENYLLGTNWLRFQSTLSQYVDQ